MAEKIRKGFISVVWVVLIGAVAIAIYTRKDQSTQPAPAAQALQLQVSPQPSETPTPSPIPTIDTYPTYQVLEIDRMRAEADLQAINLQIKETERMIAQAEADEAAALASIADSEAKRAEQLRLTTEAQNEQIKLKIELQRLENERTAIQNEQAAIVAIQAKADAQSGANWGLFVGGGLVAGAIIFAGLTISNMPIAEKPVNSEPVSEVSPALNDLPAYPGGLDTRLFAAFLSPGTLRKAAALVAAGVPLVHDNFTPIARCMSEGQFARLQAALVEYRAATWNDETHKAGITLTEKGVKFFADLQTTSPLNQDAPKTIPQVLKQSIDDGFTPIGEGD